MFKSNQFPVKVPQKPASYTLQYDSKNVLDCLNTSWIVCKNKRDEMIRSGHNKSKFYIKANF